MPGGAALPNFYLWGTWRNKTIKEPLRVSKVSAPIKKVVLNDTCVVLLTEGKELYSFGKDPNGCLGLGHDQDVPDRPITEMESPKKIEGLSNVIDVQMGKTHCVALTGTGDVYCWGAGMKGQLGNGASGEEDISFEPQKVVGPLVGEQIMQIAVVKSSTFAVATSGVVYAWGDNPDNILGLDDRTRTLAPLPVQLKQLQEVRRLEVFENRTIIAICRNEQVEQPFDDMLDEEPDSAEVVEVFKGIEEMKEAIKKTQVWWNHLMNIQHGRPYESSYDRKEVANIEPSLGHIEEDLEVEVERLETALQQIDNLVANATKEMNRLRRQSNTRTVWLLLCMFIDDCRLRREKVQHMRSARLLRDITRKGKENGQYSVTDFGSNANEEIRRIIHVTKDLQDMLDEVKKIDAVDLPITILKVTLMEALECKLQLHDTRIELLKAAEAKPSNPILPSLRIIKDRWHSLKQFSLYALYKECENERRMFENDDDHLAFLVKESNKRIDQILQIQDNRVLSRDTLVPALCYDLLQENAELRKMTNSYQLHVLMLYEGKNTTNMAVGLNMQSRA